LRLEKRLAKLCRNVNDALIVDSIVKPEASPPSRLSVVSISLRAYSSLFVYLPEFGRLVWLTFLLALGAELILLFPPVSRIASDGDPRVGFGITFCDLHAVPG
jgi:hypothetical protein